MITLIKALEPAEIAIKECSDNELYLAKKYSSCSYKSINGALENSYGIDAGAYQKNHEAMLNLCRPLSEPITLWRGLHCSPGEINVALMSLRWNSATICEKIARYCATGQHISSSAKLNGMLIRLNVDAGVNVLAMCKILERDQSSMANDEKEIAIAPRALYELVSLEDDFVELNVKKGFQD